jgi:hypothetical protein
MASTGASGRERDPSTVLSHSVSPVFEASLKRIEIVSSTIPTDPRARASTWSERQISTISRSSRDRSRKESTVSNGGVEISGNDCSPAMSASVTSSPMKFLDASEPRYSRGITATLRGPGAVGGGTTKYSTTAAEARIGSHTRARRPRPGRSSEASSSLSSVTDA